MKNLSEYLGFYFVIFQRDISELYVRCWIDGDDTYTLLPTEEFLEFVNKSEDPTVIYAAKMALTETSLFLWNVDDNLIKRLHADSFEKSNMMKEIYKKGADILYNSTIEDKTQGTFSLKNIVNRSQEILRRTFKK